MFKTIQRLRHALRPELKRSDISTLLNGLNPKLLLSERITNLEHLMEWVRLPTKTSPESPWPPHLQARCVRFKFLMQFLERNPAEAEFLAKTLQEIIVNGSALRLFSLSNLSDSMGFFNELSDRIVQKFLPHVFAEGDLVQIIRTIFTEEEDAEWLELCHSVILPPFSEFMEKHSVDTQGLYRDMEEALMILSTQIASLGMTRRIRRRLPSQRISDTHFLLLNKAVMESQNQDSILLLVQKCRIDLIKVRESINASGVSVALIHHIEKISFLLDRMETLMRIQMSDQTREDTKLVGDFTAHLVRDEIQQQGVREFIYDNIHMLTRKIVERAGEKGGHYIASTPAERLQLYKAAAWAGVLTAFTTILKAWIGLAHFPFFFEGFFFFLNYALGFLLMQRWHLVLSSKQPAYMASALAHHLEEFQVTKKIAGVADVIRSISISQLITAASNLLWVVPVTLLLDLAWVKATGSHLLSPAYSQEIILKHHPLSSLTLPFAALTGVFLWLSSVVAGWVENWIVFRSVPQMIEGSSFFHSLLGADRTKGFASKFAANVGAAVGNLAIAFMLAAPIVAGKFTGLPLDIRHVTLATGTISLALSALAWDLPWTTYVSLGSSVVMIGFLNFGVSFYCATRMAAIAARVPTKHLKIIFRYAFRVKAS